MKEYNFTEATPLLSFWEMYQEKIVGKRLKNFYTNYWPNYGRCSLSEYPIVFELDGCFVAISYFVPSDMRILIGTKEEFEQNKDIKDIIDIKNRLVDYYDEEFERGVKKEEIENCRITKIEVERFSSEFECDPCTEEIRPEGGDYFSTVRIHLDSGIALCFCGADGILDGYIEIWCE